MLYISSFIMGVHDGRIFTGENHAIDVIVYSLTFTNKSLPKL